MGSVFQRLTSLGKAAVYRLAFVRAGPLFAGALGFGEAVLQLNYFHCYPNYRLNLVMQVALN